MVAVVEPALQDADDNSIEQPKISKNVSKSMAQLDVESEKESEKEEEKEEPKQKTLYYRKDFGHSTV